MTFFFCYAQVPFTEEELELLASKKLPSPPELSVSGPSAVVDLTTEAELEGVFGSKGAALEEPEPQVDSSAVITSMREAAKTGPSAVIGAEAPPSSRKDYKKRKYDPQWISAEPMDPRDFKPWLHLPKQYDPLYYEKVQSGKDLPYFKEWYGIRSEIEEYDAVRKRPPAWKRTALDRDDRYFTGDTPIGANKAKLRRAFETIFQGSEALSHLRKHPDMYLLTPEGKQPLKIENKSIRGVSENIYDWMKAVTQPGDRFRVCHDDLVSMLHVLMKPA